jgi:hypothetical protein
MKPVTFFMLFISGLTVYGHEGHGLVEHGPAHYLLSPVHSIVIAGVLIGAVLLMKKVLTKRV